MTAEQQIGVLQAYMNKVKTDVEEIRDDVRQMRDILLKAQGGWRTLVILGTVSAAIGTAMAQRSPQLYHPSSHLLMM